MYTPKLTRAKQRRMRELENAIERIEQEDLSYFARFPHRRYRFRQADRAEIERMELMGVDITLAPSERRYATVLLLSPGICIAQLFDAPADLDEDLITKDEVLELFREGSRTAYAMGILTNAELLFFLDVFE